MNVQRKPMRGWAMQWFPPGNPKHAAIGGVVSSKYVGGSFTGEREVRCSPTDPDAFFTVGTASGSVGVHAGWWVIIDQHGDRHVCDHETFERDFEPTTREQEPPHAQP